MVAADKKIAEPRRAILSMLIGVGLKSRPHLLCDMFGGKITFKPHYGKQHREANYAAVLPLRDCCTAHRDRGASHTTDAQQWRTEGRRLTLAGTSIAGRLQEQRSYLENGRCYFRLENGRARAEFGGKCDSTGIEGRFESFAGGELKNGAAKAAFALAGGAPVAEASGSLPSGKKLLSGRAVNLVRRLQAGT